MIIDSHAHYLPQEIAENTTFYKVHWSDIDGQLKIMDEAGIEKAVLLYPTTDAHLNLGGRDKLCSIYNEELAKISQKHKHRFIPAAILPIDNEAAITKELQHIEDLGLKAISLASSFDGRFLDEQSFYPIYTEAERLGLVIFVHSQITNPIGFDRVKDPLLMPVVEFLFDITMCLGKMMTSGVFMKFPKVKFIFAHFAGVTPFLKDRFDSTYKMLRQRGLVKDLGKTPTEILSNVYVDTSGVKSASLLYLALEFFSKDRILWGSDYPANQNMLDSISSIRNLDINKEDKEKILGANISSLI